MRSFEVKFEKSIISFCDYDTVDILGDCEVLTLSAVCVLSGQLYEINAFPIAWMSNGKIDIYHSHENIRKEIESRFENAIKIFNRRKNHVSLKEIND